MQKNAIGIYLQLQWNLKNLAKMLTKIAVGVVIFDCLKVCKERRARKY